MSCEINAGRSVSCKDASGGIKGIYILNFVDTLTANMVIQTPANPVVQGDNLKVVAMNTGEDAGLNVYYFQLRREMASLDINVNSSPENGTTFFEQQLVMNFNKFSVSDADKAKILSYGRPQIIVEDNQSNLILLGAANGMDVTSGSISTGQAFGDRNGVSLTFTGREVEPYFELVGGSDTPSDAAPSPFENFEAADITIAS
jgi:hypothetical protein